MAVISLNSHRKLPKVGKPGDVYMSRTDDGKNAVHLVTVDGELVEHDKLLVAKHGPQGEQGPRGPEGKAPTEAELEKLIRRVVDTILVHRGRDGKDGERGPKGEPGDVSYVGPADIEREMKKLRARHARVIATIVTKLESSDGDRVVKAHYKRLLAELKAE